MARRLGALCAALSLVLSVSPTAAGGSDDADLTIVSRLSQLSAAEVRAADITDRPAGQSILQSMVGDKDTVDVTRRPHRVYVFGDQETVIDTATPLAVYTGLNAAGKLVYQVTPIARPTHFSARAGYAVPPNSAWVYNTDGGFTNTYNNWKRTIFWTINAAWGWRACPTCTKHTYWRMYGHMQAATLTGYDERWRRAWLEFDNQGNWGGSPTEVEFGEPDGKIDGKTVEVTIGFGTNFSVALGQAPAVATGGYTSSYSGKLDVPLEWWHPVHRAEIASGGVQYCRDADVNTTKKITTRQGLRQNQHASLGGWNILYGMQHSKSACPNA